MKWLSDNLKAGLSMMMNVVHEMEALYFRKEIEPYELRTSILDGRMASVELYQSFKTLTHKKEE